LRKLDQRRRKRRRSIKFQLPVVGSDRSGEESSYHSIASNHPSGAVILANLGPAKRYWVM
jgi:hypothetical protein